MLTRLKIEGFKNIRDADVRFGPFTCIAGANGIGKSNLFDAITFLGTLADEPFLDAAAAVRGEAQGGPELRSLFFRHGDYVYPRMRFEAEIIVSSDGEDHLGQPARATCTFLRYRLELRLIEDDSPHGAGIELVEESLEPLRKGDAPKLLPFAPKKKAWRDSVVRNDRGGTAFISTKEQDGKRVILLHQDGGSRGKPNTLLASRLPRTGLSSASAESPTALLAKQELRSWKLLQLEPGAMRRPDELNAPAEVGTDGAHLPKALHVLVSAKASNGVTSESGTNVLTEIGNRLSLLVDDVRDVRIDEDEKRELLTLYVSGRDGLFHPARALSDGTLRFLALAIIDKGGSGSVLCLEEPENGIHPSRIGAMLRLLEDIAVDIDFPVDVDNPLRQVIVNTHSPGVVEDVEADSILFADSYEFYSPEAGERQRATRFISIPKTWRAEADAHLPTKSLLDIVRYLKFASDFRPEAQERGRVRDVIEQQLGFGFNSNETLAAN